MMLSVVMAFTNIPYTSLGMTAAAEEYDDAYWDDLGANDSWDDTGADESWDDSQDGENWDELQAQAEAEAAAREEAQEQSEAGTENVLQMDASTRLQRLMSTVDQDEDELPEAGEETDESV